MFDEEFEAWWKNFDLKEKLKQLAEQNPETPPLKYLMKQAYVSGYKHSIHSVSNFSNRLNKE